MKKPLIVSVIVPVYNVEAYLRACLDSVLAQTLGDIEVICVDDGSTDGSGAILAEYAEKDGRVRVIAKENGGLSSARNAGLDVAGGDYVYYLDSDDFILPQTLEACHAAAEADGLDMVFFDGETFFEDGRARAMFPHYETYYWRKGAYPAVATGPELFAAMVVQEEYRSQVSLQFARRAFLAAQGLRFVEGMLFEDNPYTFSAMLSAGKVGYLRERFFKRRMRAGSIMTAKRRDAKYAVDAFRVMWLSMEFLRGRELPDEVKDAAATAVALMQWQALRECLKADPAALEAAKGALSAEEITAFRTLVEVPLPLYPKEREVAFSVIVPLYNAEAELARCLDSLLAQIYPVAEVIVVDDASTDGGAALVERYAAANPEVKLIRQTHAGPGVARNRGVAAATGDYLLFVDADDYVDPLLTLACREKLQEADYDALLFGANTVDADGKVEAWPAVAGLEGLSSVFGADREKLLDLRWYSLCWMCFRREMVVAHGLRCGETYYHEDQEFVIGAIVCARSVGILPQQLYYYCTGAPSLTRGNTEAQDAMRVQGRGASDEALLRILAGAGLSDGGVAKVLNHEYRGLGYYLPWAVTEENRRTYKANAYRFFASFDLADRSGLDPELRAMYEKGAFFGRGGRVLRGLSALAGRVGDRWRKMAMFGFLATMVSLGWMEFSTGNLGIAKDQTAWEAFASVLILAIAALNAKMPPLLSEMRWNRPMLAAFWALGGWMLLTSCFHPVGAGIRGFAVMLVVVFPCLYVAVGRDPERRDDYARMLAYALVAAGGLFLFFSMLAVEPFTETGLFLGIGGNSNAVGRVGVMLSTGALALLCIRRAGRKRGLAAYRVCCCAVLGAGVWITLSSHSRTSTIAILAQLLCFFILAGVYRLRQEGDRRRARRTRMFLGIVCIGCFAAVFLVLLWRFGLEWPSLDRLSTGRVSVWQWHLDRLNLLGNDWFQERVVTASYGGVHQFWNAHNAVLEIAYLCGVPAGLAYLAIDALALVWVARRVAGGVLWSASDALCVFATVGFVVVSSLDWNEIPYHGGINLVFFLALAPTIVRRRT